MEETKFSIDVIAQFLNMGRYIKKSSGCDDDGNAGFELVFEDGVCIVCEDFLRIKRCEDEEYTTINIDVYAPGMPWLEKAANAIKEHQCYYDGEQYAIVEEGHVNAPYWNKQEKVSTIK